MAVSTTIYDINDNSWTLQLLGSNTPDTLTLTQDGILIEYPEYTIEEPIIYPKFTFNFIGTPATIEQFGIIQEYNQPFKLTYSRSGVSYEWRGYLIDDIFNIPNTGYDEVISINGISQIEALKYRSFDQTDSANIPSIQSTINYILSNVYNTGIGYNLSFTLGNLGYVLHTNWYDEENVPMNQLEVLKKIFQFYTLIFEQDLKQKISISSYAQLYKQSSTAIDYSTIGHKAINETYSTSENYLSALVVDSILKPEDVLVNLSTDQTNEPPYLYTVRTYYWSKAFGARVKKHYRARVNYETHLHIIEEDEFPGWRFPHYDINGNGITEWWNPANLIKGNVQMPVAGMYRVSFRAWDVSENNKGININDVVECPTATGLTSAFLIKTFNRNGAADSNLLRVVPQDSLHPYATFSNKLTVTSDDYLLLSGMIGFAARWGEIGVWEDHSNPNPYYVENCYEGGTVSNDTVEDFFNNNVAGINGEWADIAVPLINYT
jgi:hypothetical protein